MYVVRIDDAGDSEFKAYSSPQRVEGDFNRALLETHEGAYQRVALYEVPGTENAGEAIEAVRAANDSARLLRLEESDATRMDRVVKKLLPHVEFKF